jgi:hypothetical protein
MLEHLFIWLMPPVPDRSRRSQSVFMATHGEHKGILS